MPNHFLTLGLCGRDYQRIQQDKIGAIAEIDLTPPEDAVLREWGTYRFKIHEAGGDGSPLVIEFQSAWGPRDPEVMRKIDAHLCESYYLKNIKWIGHDPYDGQTGDIPIAKANPE